MHRVTHFILFHSRIICAICVASCVEVAEAIFRSRFEPRTSIFRRDSTESSAFVQIKYHGLAKKRFKIVRPFG